jgi:AraC-like DNA-binding protein
VEHSYGINQTFGAIDSGLRRFPGHYLLYASDGAFILEVAAARWILPPQRAAWIAAGVPIRVRTQAPVACRSILFAPGSVPAPVAPCRVFAVTPLAREMIQHAMRWGADHNQADPLAAPFFVALAGVCAELAARPDEFWLPQARSAELGRAIDYALGQLAGAPSLAEAARAAGVSERTLARRFAEETELTWRQFLRRARMIVAMELLARPDVQVIGVAYATGFASVSAFISAFRAFVGENPSQYRRRFRPA